MPAQNAVDVYKAAIYIKPSPHYNTYKLELTQSLYLEVYGNRQFLAQCKCPCNILIYYYILTMFKNKARHSLICDIASRNISMV